MVYKIFVASSGKASFKCPECGKTRLLDVSKFCSLNKKIRLKYKCKCGCSSSLELERRKHIRKKVNLKAELVFKNKTCRATVIDISRLGLKIRAEKELDLEIGTRLVVNFVLDDATSSRVSKEVVVRTVKGNDVGAEFLSRDHYDKLGPYLLFHFS